MYCLRFLFLIIYLNLCHDPLWLAQWFQFGDPRGKAQGTIVNG